MKHTMKNVDWDITGNDNSVDVVITFYENLDGISIDSIKDDNGNTYHPDDAEYLELALHTINYQGC